MQQQEQKLAGGKRNAPLWVKIFVPLHILAITSWALPDPPQEYMGEHPKSLAIRTSSTTAFVQSSAEMLRNGFLVGNRNYLKMSPLRFYLLSTGFWQYWDMFSPNPASTDIWSDSVVTYADGSSKVYHYPRIYDLPIPQKFMKERWRKFFERAGNQGYQFLWPVFGQRVALLNYNDPKNPPVKVDLRRHSMAIAAPGKPEDTTYTEETYYRYVVDQEKLRQDKGQ
jgi:hypothetical protein